jgi:hypothetical protein
MTPEHKAKLLAANLVHGKTGTPAFQTWKDVLRWPVDRALTEEKQ